MLTMLVLKGTYAVGKHSLSNMENTFKVKRTICQVPGKASSVAAITAVAADSYPLINRTTVPRS